MNKPKWLKGTTLAAAKYVLRLSVNLTTFVSMRRDGRGLAEFGKSNFYSRGEEAMIRCTQQIEGTFYHGTMKFLSGMRDLFKFIFHFFSSDADFFEKTVLFEY